MAIVLNSLTASGPDKEDAQIIFHPHRYLIRGPSDTGKSYIRDCLWYLLGGDKLPKYLPEADGYNLLSLKITGNGQKYELVRALTGGVTAISAIHTQEDGSEILEPLKINDNDFLIELSGLKGKKLLRSMSEKGAVTSGDLRHWFILSQPNMISEDATSGSGFSAFQRVGAFNLILTGSDDDAIQLARTKGEVEHIKGQLSSAQDAIKRLESVIPSNLTRIEVSDSLGKVEFSLSALTNQYQARSSQLKELRISIRSATEDLQKVMAGRDHSASMKERFELLGKKYLNDLERLGATDEGVAVFQALSKSPCPLCNTPVELQVNQSHLKNRSQEQFREALKAEVEKIRLLRKGLSMSLINETHRLNDFEIKSRELQGALNILERKESQQLQETKVEFSADPKTLAIKLSELSAHLNNFDEIERLKAEVERLSKETVRKRVPLERSGGNASTKVAEYAQELLSLWGFSEIERVSLDNQACDLVLNDRIRLSFGAGKRAIFLTAMLIAMLKHSMENSLPHLGFVVIDSPLKAYADPKNRDSSDIELLTVTAKFYDWLASWEGPGQIIIMENEEISEKTAEKLKPLEFTRINGEGRAGFYLKSAERPKDEADSI